MNFLILPRFEELENRCRDSFRGQRNVTLFLKNNEAFPWACHLFMVWFVELLVSPQELCFLTGSLSRIPRWYSREENEDFTSKGTSEDFAKREVRSEHLLLSFLSLIIITVQRKAKGTLKVQDELLISIHIYVVSGFMLSSSPSGPHMGKDNRDGYTKKLRALPAHPDSWRHPRSSIDQPGVTSKICFLDFTRSVLQNQTLANQQQGEDRGNSLNNMKIYDTMKLKVSHLLSSTEKVKEGFRKKSQEQTLLRKFILRLWVDWGFSEREAPLYLLGRTQRGKWELL